MIYNTWQKSQHDKTKKEKSNKTQQMRSVQSHATKPKLNKDGIFIRLHAKYSLS